MGKDFAEGGFDCGIRLAELGSEDIVAVPIGPDQQHIVVGAPQYLNEAPVLMSPSNILHHRCAQLRMPSGGV